jgi:UDP-N-acetylmuramoylalanine--D-glutamate ligase
MTQLELVDGVVRGAAFLEGLPGRSATVVGLAPEAAAAARLLHAAGARVRVEPGATRADLTGDALVVVTVATALRVPAVVAAREAGVPVLGDLDLAWLVTEADAFALTGGSGTGAALHLASALVDDRALLVAPTVEQLAAVQVFRPRVAVILPGAEPLAVRLIAHQTARDCLVLSDDDPGARAVARSARGHVVWLSAVHALDHGVYIARGRIAARLNGHVEEICPVAGIPPAQHESALAAVACALWTGLDPEVIGQFLIRRFALELPRVDSRLRHVMLGRVAWVRGVIEVAGSRAAPARSGIPARSDVASTMRL